MKNILFQGDSITDAGRPRDNDATYGAGYPALVSAELLSSEPGEYTCRNRGISGNRIVDVYARIKADIINLSPDVMSILIGINDIWHEINWKNGVAPDKFYKIYTMLIEEVKAALPNIKIMILEPFVLEGPATSEHFAEFKSGCAEMAVRAKQVAEENGLVFVPLQCVFDKACEKAEPTYWLRDGVHPTTAGHALIKNEWLKAYKNL